MAENDSPSTAKVGATGTSAGSGTAEEHDREYWLERPRYFKTPAGKPASRHALAGALHDLKGHTSQKNVQARLDKFLKGDGK